LIDGKSCTEGKDVSVFQDDPRKPLLNYVFKEILPVFQDDLGREPV